jgi:hypothetical protein
LNPIAEQYPKDFVRALLHTWEKNLTAESASSTSLNDANSCIIEILNSLHSSSPVTVISSLVPLAM